MSNLEQAIDSLGVTVNRIADERNQLKAQRDELLAAAKALLEGSVSDSLGEFLAIAKADHSEKIAALRQAIEKCED